MVGACHLLAIPQCIIPYWIYVVVAVIRSQVNCIHLVICYVSVCFNCVTTILIHFWSALVSIYIEYIYIYTLANDTLAVKVGRLTLVSCAFLAEFNLIA
jgi:hypothetical protein